MEHPLVSVIMPVLNEEKRIARALDSMRRQSYEHLEIIVVDDGSSDGTRDVVESLARTDARIRYEYREPSEKKLNWRGYDINAGYAARNRGFDLARGEWITTQDADDASLLNRIQVQYELAKRYEATMVTVQWQKLTDTWLGEKLDVERVFRQKGEHSIVIRPEILNRYASERRGPLMREPFHRYVPFPIKWFPYTRSLFYRSIEPFPGADNSMLFHRSVLDAGLRFRPRRERTWGVPSGRGSGRDFAFLVTDRFKNSWSFRLPMYLWDVRITNEEYAGYERYLV